MPTPPANWAFNKLKIDIAKKMTDKDLEEAKTIFEGRDGIGQRLLEEIKTPLELFKALEKRTFLDRNNLLFFQAMLYHLDRMDLLDLAIDFAHTHGNAIHFKSPPREPANGYEFVQFHVEGKDFSTVTRNDLERLRTTAATLMLVPARFVTIAGVEPSSSIQITLMIPTRYVKYLELALKRKHIVKDLTNLRVDTVCTNNLKFMLQGADVVGSVMQTHIKSVYETLRDTEKRLEDCEIECLHLKRNLARRPPDTFGDLLKFFYADVDYKNGLLRKVPRLAKESAYAFFKFATAQIRKLGYNEEAIACLLDSHYYLMNIKAKEKREFLIAQFVSENQQLRTRLLEMQILNARPKSQYISGVVDFEYRLRQNVLVPETIVQLAPFAVEILKVLSDELTSDEKQQLLKKYTWPENDESTRLMKLKESIFLAELYFKEVQVSKKHVDCKEFISNALIEVNRLDLKQKFLKMLEKHETDFLQSVGGYGKPQQRNSTEPTSSNSDLNEKVNIILQKVSHIENVIQASRVHYESSYGRKEFQSTGPAFASSTQIPDSLYELNR